MSRSAQRIEGSEDIKKDDDQPHDRDESLSVSDQSNTRLQGQESASAFNIGSPVPSYIYSCNISEGPYHRVRGIEFRDSPDPDPDDPKLTQVRFDTSLDPVLGNLFYDDLSKQSLTTRALRELHRRSAILLMREQRVLLIGLLNQPGTRQYQEYQDLDLNDLHLRPTRGLLTFAKDGGPDLKDLRGFQGSNHPLDILATIVMASPEINNRRGWDVRYAAFLNLKPSEATDSQDKNFLTHLNNHGIFLPDFEDAGPVILPVLSALAEQVRQDLYTPNEWAQGFKRFAVNSREANKEDDNHAIFDAFDNLTWSNKSGPWGMLEKKDSSWNLAPLTNGQLVPGAPDRSWGSRLECLRPELRNAEKLKYFIMPNDARNFILPNFICHLKGTIYNTQVLKAQALYDGALAARAMHALRLYVYGPEAWDNDAHAIASTYADSQLVMYTVRPRRASPVARTQYFMHIIDGMYLEAREQNFKRGVSMWRNLGDWAFKERNNLIEAANKVYEQTRKDTSPALDDFHAESLDHIKYYCVKNQNRWEFDDTGEVVKAKGK